MTKRKNKAAETPNATETSNTPSPTTLTPGVWTIIPPDFRNEMLANLKKLSKRRRRKILRTPRTPHETNDAYLIKISYLAYLGVIREARDRENARFKRLSIILTAIVTTLLFAYFGGGTYLCSKYLHMSGGDAFDLLFGTAIGALLVLGLILAIFPPKTKNPKA